MRNIKVYYLFRCDDNRRPSDIEPDKGFELTEIEKVFSLKLRLDILKINYDLVVEWFDCDTSTIISNEYISENNWINNLKQQSR
jgi:hypothetical protein